MTADSQTPSDVPSAPTLGVVSYLNSVPLYEPFAGDPAVVTDTPARLVARLETGELALALVPSIALARHADWVAVPEAGVIACDGAVQSVVLAHRVPLAEVRSVLLDDHSQTSAALVRILLGRAGARPEYRSTPLVASAADWASDPEALDAETLGADAALLIGDKALVLVARYRTRNSVADGSGRAPAHDASASPHGVALLDLGEAWRALTGLPFVFALWSARAGCELGAWPARLARTAAFLQTPAGLAHRQSLGAREGERLGIGAELGARYLTDAIGYACGARERKALGRFFAEAVEAGALPGPNVPPLCEYPGTPPA